jgi:formylglycine-generating enzyme
MSKRFWLVLTAMGAASCAGVLGIEEPTPKPPATVNPSAGEGGGGTDQGNAGAAGEVVTDGGKSGGGSGGGEAGTNPRGGSGGGVPPLGSGGAGEGGEAGASGEAGAAGEVGASGAAGASGDGGAGGAPECGFGEVACDAYQPLVCDGGRWVPQGNECQRYCQDGACREAPSCADALSCAGADCCETIWVPGGTYRMRYDGTADFPNGLTRTVAGFYLDRFEVTKHRFAEFLSEYAHPASGAGAHPRIPGSGWDDAWAAEPAWVPADRDGVTAMLLDEACIPEEQTWNLSDPTYPVNCVNWYLAFAFCAWDGGRLPTEAEWNYVAAHGSEQRIYPWPGDVVGSDYAAFYDPESDENPILADPVGLKVKGRSGFFRYFSDQGHDDLASNVGEWVMDGVDPVLPETCENCMTPWVDALRSFRGGAYYLPSRYLKSAEFSDSLADADFYEPGIGIRCARDSATRP